MGDPSARWWNPGREDLSRARLASVAFLVALLAMPVSLGLGSSGAAHPPGANRASGPGTAALSEAAASLSAGFGPASGAPISCSFSSSSSATCQAPTTMDASAKLVPPAVWTNLTSFETSRPSARPLGSMVWDGADGYVLLFGGCSNTNCNGIPLGDTWIFQNDQWRQLNPLHSPPGVAIAQMAYDPIDKEVVLFGGLPTAPSGATTLFASHETWTFARGDWQNRTGNLTVHPSGRYRGSMTFDAGDGYVLLFGGTASNVAAPFNQTWGFVNQTWTNLSGARGHPVPRYRADMAYDAADGYAVLFGGCTSAARCPTADTWTYENLTWVNETANISKPPSPRVYPGMAYDPRDNYTLLFGGAKTTVVTGTTYIYPAVGGTWTFANGTWTNISKLLTVEPSYRAQTMVTFDAGDNLTLLFGGTAGSQLLNNLSETYSWGPPVIASASVSPAAFDLNQSTTIRVAAAGNAQPLSYWYDQLPPGCSSLNTASLSCTPNATGNFSITAQINDTGGNTANVSVPISVSPDPVVTEFSVTPTEVTAGSPVTFHLAGASGSGTYRYAYPKLPLGCASSNSPNITCRPSASGSTTAEGSITDGAGYTVFANVTLLVNPRPGVLGFTALPSTLDIGQSTVFNLSTTGGTAPFVYTYTGLPSNCTSPTSSNFLCHPTTAGTYSVVGNVTDRFGWWANASTELTVNRALAFDSAAISRTETDPGLAVTIWLNATRGTAPYSYQYTLPAGCLSANVSSVTCHPVNPGVYPIVGTVTDSVGQQINATFNLTVVEPLTVTSFAASPALTDVGVPINLTVNWTGGTAPFGFSYAGLPTGCQSANLAAISCTPAQPGSHTVAVTVTDLFGVKVTATAGFAANRAPAITSFTASPANITLGDSTNLSVSASYGTGGLSYTYGNLPDGCLGANATFLVCAPKIVGVYTINVTVRDALGQSATATVVLSVAAAPAPAPAGLGSGTGGPFLWILLIALVVVAALAAFLWRRRKPAEAEPAPEGAPEAPPSAWDESTEPGP